MTKCLLHLVQENHLSKFSSYLHNELNFLHFKHLLCCTGDPRILPTTPKQADLLHCNENAALGHGNNKQMSCVPENN